MSKKNAANVPFHPKKWPFFYGWMILVWGTLGILMGLPGQTIGVSAFTENLIEVLGISRNQLSLAYMSGTIASSFLLPWAGRVYDKKGVRPVALVAAISLGLVLGYLSQVDRIVQWLDPNKGFLMAFLCAFFGFLLLRFFGQGVLTMVSKNMMMKWFDQRRGFATGFSNVAVSLGFSLAPPAFDYLIAQNGWREAWLLLALIVGAAFPLIILVFYRGSPEESGLSPDGERFRKRQANRPVPPVAHPFTLHEAIRNYAFWIFTLLFAMQALYITGFTFHIVSIFKEAGLPKEEAFGIFQPVAVLAVVVTLLTSSLSDRIELKYLAMAKGFASCLGILGFIFLGKSNWAYYAIIIGNGAMGGLFSVLTMVTWPRYFGKVHLGAISGQAIMMMVFGSALGPILFSGSLSMFGSYAVAGVLCFILFFALGIGAFRATNPQKDQITQSEHSENK